MTEGVYEVQERVFEGACGKNVMRYTVFVRYMRYVRGCI